MAKNNFNDLKETLLGTFNFMAEKVLDLADTAADTAKSGHQIAKLFLEKKKEESAMETAYSQLGKLYYDLHKDDAEGMFAELCADVEIAKGNIEAIDDEIAELKEAMGGDFDDIEVEFENVMNDAEDADFESVVHRAETDADSEEAPTADEESEIEVSIVEEPADEETPAEETPAEETPVEEPKESTDEEPKE